MSKTQIRVARRVVSTLTATATAITMLGSAAVGLAVAPADYGLSEGDTISANAQAGDPDVYIVNEHGYKRLFVNPAIFGLYGHLGFDKVKQVSAATRDAFPTSGLFRNCESGDQRVFGLDVISEDVANLRWVNTSGAQAVADDADFFKKVFCINNNEQALYGTGPDYNSVLDVPDYQRGETASADDEDMTMSLNGEAGSLFDVRLTGPSENKEVGEGHINSTVIALDVEADNGSDLRLRTAKIVFEHTGSGSGHLDDYAKEISVFWDTDKAAEVGVDEFSESDSQWSMNVPLDSDTVVPMGGTKNMRIAVTALADIDSADLDENWTVTVRELRYVDASGFVMTDDSTGALPATATFSFTSFGGAGNVELRLMESGDNPGETSVLVNDEQRTYGVVLLSTTLRANGSDISVNEMSFTVTPAGTGDVADIVDKLHLEVNGNVAQTLNADECTVSGDCDGTGTNTAVVYVFDDVSYALGKGGTVTVRLLADINKLDGTLFAEGDNLKADLDNDDTDAEDAKGDALTAAQLIGTVNGEFQEFGTEGAVFFLMGTSAVAQTEGISPDIGTFTIVFGGLSTGTDSYVQENCTNDGGDGVDFEVIGSGSYVSCSIMSTASSAGSNGNFKLVDGAVPATFTLTVIVNGDSDFIRVRMQGIDWLSSDIPNPPVVYDVGVEDWETETLYLSAN